MDESACAAISRFNMAGDSLARFPVDFRALFAALAFRASGEGCECCGYGGAARRIFSIGWRQTTQTGRVECRTFSAQSTHMATWPHGTSRAARGSTKQTAHGSVSSGGACSRAFSRASSRAISRAISRGCSRAISRATSRASPPEMASPSLSAEPAGISEQPAGLLRSEVLAFLRSPRRPTDLIGSGHRSRCRDWYVAISCSVSRRR
mmetsp:Transcript_39408/g.86642  ORF Transcript_39408/g.86642 Transcript_39408/m.86642 type:complete len:207 (-) Transcript_39408:621-1241(-)